MASEKVPNLSAIGNKATNSKFLFDKARGYALPCRSTANAAMVSAMQGVPQAL